MCYWTTLSAAAQVLIDDEAINMRHTAASNIIMTVIISTVEIDVCSVNSLPNDRVAAAVEDALWSNG